MSVIFAASAQIEAPPENLLPSINTDESGAEQSISDLRRALSEVRSAVPVDQVGDFANAIDLGFTAADMVVNASQGDWADASGDFVELGVGVLVVPTAEAVEQAANSLGIPIELGDGARQFSRWVGNQERYRQLREHDPARLPISERLRRAQLNPDRFYSRWNPQPFSPDNYHKAWADMLKDLRQREEQIDRRQLGSSIADGFLSAEITRQEELAREFECDGSRSWQDILDPRYGTGQAEARLDRMIEIIRPLQSCRDRGMLLCPGTDEEYERLRGDIVEMRRYIDDYNVERSEAAQLREFCEAQ